MTAIFYDRRGHEINTARFEELHSNSDYKIVRRTEVGPVLVSTVWLGIDHSFGTDVPIIFETMIFGGPFSDEQERYATEAEAIAGHEQWVEAVRTTASPESV